MRHSLILALAVTIPSLPAKANEVQPGLWEISLETRAENSPGFQPPPVSLKQCIRPQDAANPAEILGKIASPGATGCNYDRKSWAGNVFRFTMTCSGVYALVAQGEVTVTPGTLQGSLKADATVAGERVRFTNQLNARRLGNC